MSTVIKSVRGKLHVESDTFTITDESGTCMLYKGVVTKFKVTNLGLQIHGRYRTTSYGSSTIYVFVYGGDIQVQHAHFND